MSGDFSPERWIEANARARELPLRYPALRIDSRRFEKFATLAVDRLRPANAPVPDDLIAAATRLVDGPGRRRLRAAAARQCPTAWASVEAILDPGDAMEALLAGAAAASLAERRPPDPFMLRLLSTDCDLIDSPTHVLSTLIDETYVWSIEELHDDVKPTATHAYRVRRLARLLYRHAPFRRYRRVTEKLEIELEHLDRHPRTAIDIARILHACAQVDIQLRQRALEVFGP